MQELPPTGGLLQTVGIPIAHIIFGAVGAFLSLQFMSSLGNMQKASSFLSGLLLASFGTKPLADFAGVALTSVQNGMALVVGLFGMALAAKIITTIRDTDWIELLKTLNPFKKG